MNLKTVVGVTAWSLAVTVLAVNEPDVIPQPQNLTQLEGSFNLASDMRICTDPGSADTGEFLAGQLRKSTGWRFQITLNTPAGLKSEISDGILLTTNQGDANLGAEGYSLTVTTNRVVIRAPTQAGLFYGVQTLLQLLPPEIFFTNVVKNFAWQIPCVKITDSPRFKWRGLMLDVSRHFFTKDEVKQLLAVMALHKLNTFHWHLVDDHGWRIEIKKYPKLTGVGAWRSDIGFGLDPKASSAYGPDGRYGGFYTQDDIREVMAYAQKLHITIVPEIEMPGHSVAALAAYPEFSCSGQTQTTDIGAGVHAGVYCVGKDATFEFLENVLTEVFELFPSQYVHIGGDEVPKENWKKCAACQARIKSKRLKDEEELQDYFIRRIKQFVNAHGKTLIGWSEILQGGLAQSATVMDWIGGGCEAASEGHDVVMTPTSNCYFDYYQSQDHSTEPRAIGGFLPLQKVYVLEPVPVGLAPEFQKHILGAQGNLWTEYVPNLMHAEYMIFPRLSALAEVTWSPKEARNFKDFKRRLNFDEQRLYILGVNYRQCTTEGQ